MELEQQITQLIAEHKEFVGKLGEELKSFGQIRPETKAQFDAVRERLDNLQTQMDAVDLRTKEYNPRDMTPRTKSLGDLITSDPKFLERIKHEGMGIRGNEPIYLTFEAGIFGDRKAVITTGGVGTGTSGVQMPQRLFEAPIPLTEQAFRVRDLLGVRTMDSGNSFDYPVQNVRTNAASPQTEGELKAESTYGWTSEIGRIRTIAHYTNVSRQSLSDIPWMRTTIENQLRYGLLLKEESEILAGSGTGEHLEGLITAATAYDTATYNVSGDTKIDKLRHGKLQARLAGKASHTPDGMVLNPRDMHDIELIKTEEGAANKGLYIIGDPKTGTPIKFLWGLPVVESDSITYGSFLIGAFGTGAVLIDRQVVTVDISFEHDVNFTKNLATIRAEERIGLAITRPDSFIYGSFA